MDEVGSLFTDSDFSSLIKCFFNGSFHYDQSKIRNKKWTETELMNFQTPN